MQKLVRIIGTAAIIALVVSILGFGVITLFRPGWLSIAGPFVCPAGTVLEFRNATAPGKLALAARCTGNDVLEDVTLELVLTAMGVLFLVSLLPGILLVGMKEFIANLSSRRASDSDAWETPRFSGFVGAPGYGEEDRKPGGATVGKIIYSTVVF